jgi:sugar/nucleoside kinase (ribokinase family)
LSARLVLSFGEALIDLISRTRASGLEEVDSLDVREGGAPANVAVALAQVGVPSGFCGVVGNDPFAAKLRRTLTAKGVDLSRLRGTDEADTTIAFAWKNEHGDGSFRLVRLADRLLERGDVDRSGLEEAAAIVVGSVALSAEPSRGAVTYAVERAADAGVPVCFDVNMRPTLWSDVHAAKTACAPILKRATLLKLSLDDASVLFEPGISPEEALARGAETGARFTVLTDGGRGAWFTTKDRPTTPDEWKVDAFPVEVVDPTGAGDAFHAAIISRLIQRNWRELTREDVVFASAAGALTTTRSGAIGAMPTVAEIERFITEKSP